MNKEKLEKEILDLSLRNAILHGGQARVDSVIGGLVSKNSEIDPKKIKQTVQKIVEKVNKMADQKKEAERIGLNVEKISKPEREGLPDLPGAKKGSVITRFAPNPSGPLHIGHARTIILNYLFSRKYDGKFILRYDDTDPKIKRPMKKAYDWIMEDLEWLGAMPDLVVYASDRMETYLELGYEAIKSGFAYVCTCKPSKWRKLRDQKKPCPCRNSDSLKKWEKMLNGEYKDGEAVVRIKTDMKHKNPAIRDWPAFRIIDEPNHPRIGNEFRVWPLYNFASAVDDHLLGVTHVLRAQEHSTNTVKQKYLYDYFGWKMPVTIHHGRVTVEGTIMSKSKIMEGVRRGEFSGMDDPRLGTLKALRRRGFQPQAIKNMMIHLGIKHSDSAISMKKLSAFNRKVIDFASNRYFFVENPIEIEVMNPLKEGKIKLPLHVEDRKRGFRILNAGKEFFIDKKDFCKGKAVRLHGLYNIRLGKKSECIGDEIIKEMPKIQWIPKGSEVNVRIVLPGKEINGLAEKNVLNEKIGNTIQFERFGFVRIDSKKPLVCYFAHK